MAGKAGAMGRLATAVCSLFVLALPAGAQRLQNPGFEGSEPISGWTLHVFGASPAIGLDSAVKHSGLQCLRISADSPSDTALGQELKLRPNGWYRFTGWVRTRGLDPHGAPTFGTFQIQLPGGRGVIASGANHGGDSDWTEVPIYFRAPPGGLTRIAVFFVGYGRGTGTAWFDDLRLQEIDPHMLPIKVTREPACSGEISPFQYGQFIEYLCDLVPGMWAEKLYDNSFEGLHTYNFVYLKETDFKEKPWYPSGATNRAVCSLDPENPVSGKVSQKIAVEEGPPATAGISQDGIAVEKGGACAFSCWLRQTGVTDPVHVRLRRGELELAACDFRPGTEWRKFTARLIPSETTSDATLIIEFRGPGTLWIDNASLMPEKTVGGWRPDVVEALRALKPGIIRFGGSTIDFPSYSDFDWRDTVGDPDHRRPFYAWGGLQPTGPGLEEIVQLIRAAGAEPLICVRFNDRAPKDAADEVEYFNGADDTPMGALRARNGHPESYHIRYWQIGNEILSKEYDEKLAGFCRAMKAADPSIKLLSSFPTRAVVHNAGEWLDFVCPHQYGCDDLAGKAAEVEEIRQILKEEAPGRNIKIGVTEWNTTAGDAGPRRAMLWTLANALACSRYHNFMHRNADIMEIANRSNLTNSFCSGIIQTDRHRLYKTPTYYAQELYANLAGSRPLKVESEIPADAGPDISATLSSDGKELTLFAVNDGPQPIVRPLDLSAFGNRGQSATMWVLADRDRAGEPDVTNSFADPERVTPHKVEFRATSGKFEFRFPAYSLVVIRFRIES